MNEWKMRKFLLLFSGARTRDSYVRGSHAIHSATEPLESSSEANFCPGYLRFFTKNLEKYRKQDGTKSSKKKLSDLWWGYADTILSHYITSAPCSFSQQTIYVRINRARLISRQILIAVLEKS